jgi:hypothetical protein
MTLWASMTILSLTGMLSLNLFQAISAELYGPQLLDGGDELGHRGDILFF